MERVGQVAAALGVLKPSARVVTVAGTNGKGSTVALLQSILLQAGFLVGSYTSPHLLRYNERIRIDGIEAADESLCAAFEEIDRVRGAITLTYFEWGTLAALLLFDRQPLDLWILEVGLGGRLDAVNVVDADVAVVTTIDIDHQEWLGQERDQIGREKAGIFRRGRPAVIAEPDPPASVIAVAEERGTPLSRLGMTYRYEVGSHGWSWQGGLGSQHQALPFPALRGELQLQNSAAVLEVIEQLRWWDRIDLSQLHRGLERVQLSGRMEQISHHPEVVVDVAHNRQGAESVARYLAAAPVKGRTIAVVGMLCDKVVIDLVTALQPWVTQWVWVDLDTARGCSAVELMQRAAATDVETLGCGRSPQQGVALAREHLEEDGRIVVLGSFYTVAPLLQ